MSQWREMIQGTDRCLSCHDLYDGEIGWSWMLGFSEKTRLCPLCTTELKTIHEIACQECGRPANKESGNKPSPEVENEKRADICYDCQRWHQKAPWSTKEFRHRSLYEYNPFLQELLAAFKYRGDAELASLFSNNLKKSAKKVGMFQFVTYIPLAESRQWTRGFNQAELLAKDFPNVVSLLRRDSVSGNKQSKRTREERIAAMEYAFTLSDEGKSMELKGKSILLIDDIYTTGATLRCAASVLYGAGAEFVGAVTVARAVGKKAKESKS